MNEWWAVPLAVILIVGPIGAVAAMLPIAAGQLRRRTEARDAEQTAALERLNRAMQNPHADWGEYERAFDAWARLAVRPGAVL